MGRQVQFYMAPQDEEEFLRAVRDRHGAQVLSTHSRSATPQTVIALPPADSPEGRSGFVLFNPAVNNVLRFHVMPDGDHVIDKRESSVIEFSRSRTIDGRLWHGRIWADMNTREGPKDQEFIKWYNEVSRWLKRAYVRDVDGMFVGPHAASALGSAAPAVQVTSPAPAEPRAAADGEVGRAEGAPSRRRS